MTLHVIDGSQTEMADELDVLSLCFASRLLQHIAESTTDPKSAEDALRAKESVDRVKLRRMSRLRDAAWAQHMRSLTGDTE